MDEPVTLAADLEPTDSTVDATLDALTATLRDQILTGQLSPGSVVSQVKLARSFAVGRTTLREALRMLQGEGLIQSEYNRRVRVAPLSTSELVQIYAHRVVLEAVAIRVSTPCFSVAELARMRDLVTEMNSFMDAPAEHMVEWEYPHREFHAMLVAHAGDRILAELGRLQDHASRYRAILGVHAVHSPAQGAQEHADLIALCAADQRDAAGKLLATHLARSGFALIAQADPSHDALALREALNIVAH